METFGGLGAHLEVVLQGHRLAIESELRKVGMVVKQIERPINAADEAPAEHLEGLVSLAVPVGVGNDDAAAGELGHSSTRGSRGEVASGRPWRRGEWRVTCRRS